jgi:hypothetical protein
MRTLTCAVTVVAAILIIATTSSASDSVATAACQFTTFDVGNGPTFAGRINRWHNVIGTGETGSGFFIRYPDGAVKTLVVTVPGDLQAISYRNAFGVMVGFFESGTPDTNFVEHGFIDTNGQVKVFDYPGAENTQLYGINRYGSIVGTANLPGQPTFMFKYSGGHFLTLAAGKNPVPGAISDTGVIVGTHTVTTSAGTEVEHGFVLANGSLQDVVFPGADNTELHDVNALGHIVGTYQVGSVINSFLIEDGQFLKVKGSDVTQASGINGFDQVVGAIGSHGFIAKCP